MKTELHSIQALRAFAAFIVVVTHITGYEHQYSPDQIMPSLLYFGYSGVDLFFVISGFIMVYVTHEKPHGLKQAVSFFVARIARIYPLWWLCMGLLMAYHFVRSGLPYDPAAFEGRSELSSFLINSILLLPDKAMLPLLAVGWTLLHEMHFYLVFALILILPQRFQALSLIIWCISSAIGSFWFHPGVHSTNAFNIFFHPLTMEFLLGVAVAFIYLNGLIRRSKMALIIGIVWLMIAWLYWHFSTDIIFPQDWTRVLCFGPAYAFIIHGLVNLERDKLLNVPTSLKKVGDWSYSLYLIHIFVVTAVCGIAFQKLRFTGFLDNIIAVFLTFTFSIIAAAVLYSLYERPMLKLTGKLRRKLF